MVADGLRLLRRLRGVVLEVRKRIMTTNDIRKASLWRVLWSRYRKISWRRLTLGPVPNTVAGASWCGRRFGVTCVRESVGRTSRTGPSLRGLYSCRTRCGVAWRVLDTAARKPCARCGIGSIELPVPGDSSRHLCRSQVVRPRGRLGESLELEARSRRPRATALRPGGIADGAGKCLALLVRVLGGGDRRSVGDAVRA